MSSHIRLVLWMYATLAAGGIGFALLGMGILQVLQASDLMTPRIAGATLWAMRLLMVASVVMGAALASKRGLASSSLVLSLSAFGALFVGLLLGSRVEQALVDMDGAIALIIALVMYGAGILGVSILTGPRQSQARGRRRTSA